MNISKKLLSIVLGLSMISSMSTINSMNNRYHIPPSHNWNSGDSFSAAAAIAITTLTSIGAKFVYNRSFKCLSKGETLVGGISLVTTLVYGVYSLSAEQSLRTSLGNNPLIFFATTLATATAFMLNSIYNKQL